MDANYNGLRRGQYAPDGTFEERAFGDKRNLAYGTGLIQPLVLALDNAQPLKEFPLAGDVIYLDRRSTGEIRFALDMAWAARFPLAANGGMKGIPYKQLLLEWDAQPGKVAYLWTGYAVELIPPNQDISSIGSITNPVDLTSSTIRDIAFGDSNAAANECFMGGDIAGASAGNFTHLQLYNPIGSGKVLYLDHATISTNVAGRIRLQTHAAGLNYISNGINRNVGGAVGVGEIRDIQTGSKLGTFAGALYLLANTLTQFPFSRPIRIPEGQGVLFVADAVNCDVSGIFQWRERDV